LIRHALDRAESLKGIKKEDGESTLPNLPSVPETDFPTDFLPSETSSSLSSGMYKILNTMY
jgi:hypothetical protein